MIIGRTREVEGLRRDGERFPLELAVTELVIEGERLFVGVLRDISQRKEMERIKNEFISTVSHELRTPLTSIRGSLGLIIGGAAGDIPQQASMMVDLAAKNTERLISLVNDILDIEKVDSGLLEFQFERLDVAPLVRQVIETSHGYAEEYGITFTMTRSEDGTWVRGDGDRLSQVVANLLSNAAKFSPQGGTVEISVERLDGTARIAVADRGPGIAEEFRPRLFERFSQGDSSDTRAKGGTGLGLNITRAIVERHGGQITFDTETGVGTTFRVDLPLWREVERKTPAGSLTTVRTAAGERTGDFPRLLYVEDDPDLVRVVSALLDSVAEVVAATTLTEALRHIENERFDLAVIDVDLPDGSGLDLLAQLGNGGPSTTPAMIFSADQVDASVAAKVEAALVKSKTSDRELVETIKSLIAAKVKNTAAGHETP